MAAIHIAFGDSAAGNLKAAFKIGVDKNWESGTEHIDFTSCAALLNCSDRFAIGPVYEMDLPEGFFDRINWIGDFLEACMEPEMTLDDVDDRLEKISDFYKKLAWVENDCNVVLWHGQNVSEWMGTRLVASLLPECQLFEVDLQKMDSAVQWEQAGHKPNRLAECSPEWLASLFNHIKPVSADTKSAWAREWDALIQTPETLRVWTENGLESVEMDYFDRLLMDHCNETPKMASRIIGELLATGICDAGEDFLALRLKHLIESGKLQAEGSLSSIREYTVTRCVEQVV